LDPVLEAIAKPAEKCFFPMCQGDMNLMGSTRVFLQNQRLKLNLKYLQEESRKLVASCWIWCVNRFELNNIANDYLLGIRQYYKFQLMRWFLQICPNPTCEAAVKLNMENLMRSAPPTVLADMMRREIDCKGYYSPSSYFKLLV
jgi:hypothetical protein